MRTTKYHLGLIASSVLSVLALSVMPVAAEHGGSNTSGSGDATVATATATASSDDSTVTSTGGDTETGAEVHAGDNASIRQQAQQLLNQKRKTEVKQKTTEERQKACQAHQAEINTRAKSYAASAQKHLDTFNSIFTKVQNFYTAKNLNVANYDALVAAAKDKQTAAQTAVDNLKALDVSIDCSSSDPASTVATLKTAVANARTALQDYRKAIKDVVVALKGASTSATKTDSSGNSTSTDSGTSTTTTTTNTTGGNQ